MMEFYLKIAPALYSGVMIGLALALVRIVHRYPPYFLSGVNVRVPWGRFGGRWITVGLLLGLADIVTTVIAGVEHELNPLVVYYLTRHGPGAFVAVKLSCMAVFMLAWRLFEAFPQPAKRIFQAIIVVVTVVPMTAVIVNNLYWLCR